jgi:hypothetical protein
MLGSARRCSCVKGHALDMALQRRSASLIKYLRRLRRSSHRLPNISISRRRRRRSVTTSRSCQMMTTMIACLHLLRIMMSAPPQGTPPNAAGRRSQS